MIVEEHSNIEYFFKEIKKINGVTHLDLIGDDVYNTLHLYVTFSKSRCKNNEIEKIHKLMKSQKWFPYTLNSVP